ncbi:MAG: late competence development ComFB family protein [Limnochordaceae bacterium]|uniref:Late competence development ComFB family protein n=1 Tax=Carboxydichorda subterranea TaxID=3109565 RepID=A0ABZ1C085_9FIRM|nr:late competence development ComFB family protein [Limnochorda sp. L945t]MBE3598214.1 late competence development ComFB family protein [Limnochordaceae bacterium]WRP18260.1 late competence development ComFB family protein [Limnochorda sp. L945t]
MDGERAFSNRMEQAVRDALDEALAYHPDACRCERCRRDITALALRSLPARYAGSSAGTVIVDVELQRLQSRLEIFKALHRAILEVKSRPHHARPD